jgi:DNA-binding PadR family transcriptional regulator
MGRALGEFEQLVLLALVELGEDAYGAAIGRVIEERTGRAVSAGAVYTALDRLESRGLVSSGVGEPTPERGGRRKKFYVLEPAGALELQRAVEVLQAMAEGLLPRLKEMAGEGGR